MAGKGDALKNSSQKAEKQSIGDVARRTLGVKK